MMRFLHMILRMFGIGAGAGGKEATLAREAKKLATLLKHRKLQLVRAAVNIHQLSTEKTKVVSGASQVAKKFSDGHTQGSHSSHRAQMDAEASGTKEKKVVQAEGKMGAGRTKRMKRKRSRGRNRSRSPG